MKGKLGNAQSFMLADNPVDGNPVSIFDRNEAQLLDSLLIVLAPDGSLLSRGDDSAGENGAGHQDALVRAMVLPEDGVCKFRRAAPGM
ncbi:MAG: hypothetical protein R3D55_00230 [Chloroflexota bacterium]